MRKVALFSILLLLGLAGSQILPGILGASSYDKAYHWIQALTMVALSYIMIHVGREFDLDKSNLKQYGWDYVVAATAAAFPWIFCTLYFVFVIIPRADWDSWNVWKESLLAARFSAPTSAGVLFSMLAAAGLSATWVFKKARILAIFDDLDTVLLMIPLKMAMVGMKWQLGVVVAFMALMLWIGFRFLHRFRIPTTWPWVLSYSIVMVAIIDFVHSASKAIDPQVPIHIEVLLPAFVLGCVMAHPKPHASASEPGAHHDARDDAHHDHASPSEARASTIVSCAFMFLVGLTMPSIALSLGAAASGKPAADVLAHPDGAAAAAEALKNGQVGWALRAFTPPMGWGEIILHVLVVTIIANLGKMFPALCYRKETPWRERLAVAVGMWPRGEVGAGVLVISLSYGIGGPIVVIAMLSLALNLVLTGVFIVMVKRLIGFTPTARTA
jgi:Kef-type K+ transport system membrane component KefB